MAFAPNSSGPAVGGGNPFAGTPSNVAWLPPLGSTGQTAKFLVDWEGAYLIRLVVDAGLPTEDVMYLRLRRLTQFGDIKLVAAGERRDQNGVIPADASAEGWANDQNQNLQRLTALIRRLATGERRVYVDVNKGRDNAAVPNTPTNLVNLPGADATELSKTGINIKAEGFGDFSAISDGIAYAMDAASRGEPPVSEQNPYLVIVRSGLYVENLVFQPNVHVISERGLGVASGGGLRSLDVLVRTTKTPNSRHEYAAPPGAGILVLKGLNLENLGATSEPVFYCDGAVALIQFAAQQQGTGLTQGPALHQTGGKSLWSDVQFGSEAMADLDRYVVILDGPLEVMGRNVDVEGAAGFLVNPSLSSHSILVLGNVTMDTKLGRAVRGYPSFMNFRDSDIRFTGGASTVPLISIDNMGGGAGAASHDVAFGMINSSFVSGDLSFDKTGTSGSTGMALSHIITNGDILFPTGALDHFEAGTLARSLGYEDQWVRPETGVKTVPALNALGTDNVQDTLDWLVNLTLPRAGAPFRGLTETYNGIASLNPLVYGGGLGRNMLADSGAMQVTGASSPMYLEDDGRLRGGGQFEGIVDVGPLKSDGLGSEINLNPNQITGAGPIIRLGRDSWTDALVTAVAAPALPAGLVLAGFQAPVGAITKERPFNLILRALNLFESETGEAGRVVLEGASARAADWVTPAVSQGGDAFVQGGDVLSMVPGSAARAGNVWLVPGSCLLSSSEDGMVRIASAEAKFYPILTAANVYAVADPTAGVFYMATVNGVESFAVGAADTLGDVVDLINSTARSFFARDLGGNLSFGGGNSGVNADFFYIGDNQGGALNTKLGELMVSGGAAYTPGVMPDSVGMFCVADDALAIDGSLIKGYHFTDANYVVNPEVEIVGVDTTGGGVDITLPDDPPAGRCLTIKDEGGSALANLITLLPVHPALIEQVWPAGPPAPTLQFVADWDVVNIYYNGTNWYVR